MSSKADLEARLTAEGKKFDKTLTRPAVMRLEQLGRVKVEKSARGADIVTLLDDLDAAPVAAGFEPVAP